jgi:hypothetical protein
MLFLIPSSIKEWTSEGNTTQGKFSSPFKLGDCNHNRSSAKSLHYAFPTHPLTLGKNLFRISRTPEFKAKDSLLSEITV